MSSVFQMHSNSSESQEIPRGIQGAWPGGPCPQCGDDMPANLVHCRSCRTLLNNMLTEDSVEIPQFVPLKEIDPSRIVSAGGHYVKCPGCRQELRIHSKYRKKNVVCRHCNQNFPYDKSVKVVALYSNCPHCKKELRASVKYTGQNVACRFCSGPLMLTD